MKNVLVLVGSNNDIEEKGKPTKLADILETTIKKINTENQKKQIDYYLDSCSADRTPDLLPFVINQRKFDGIIYSGGYSLVLGAAIQEALMKLRSEEEVADTRQERENLIKRGGLGLQYLPGMYAKNQLLHQDSKYYHDTIPAGVTREIRFIPTIGVPGKDTPSQGLSALLSIAENPAGCEPRPVVGVGRIDTAIEAMHNILYGMKDGFELVTITYEQPRQHLSSEDPETKKGAEEIKKRLKEFGFLRSIIVPASDVTSREYQQNPNELVIAVCNDYTTAASAAEKTINSLDGSTRLMINCPAKKKMSGQWEQYLETITQLDNTISVGVGNYDNAAILAAQLLNKPEVNEKMWEYRNQKTLKGVINKPIWLIDGKMRRE